MSWRLLLARQHAQIRARKAEGYLIEKYWTAREGINPKTNEPMWGICGIWLADDGTDLVRGGRVVVDKRSVGWNGQGEQFHINKAVPYSILISISSMDRRKAVSSCG